MEREYLIVAYEPDGTIHDAQGRMTAKEACRVARSIVRYGRRQGVTLVAFVSDISLSREGFNWTIQSERNIYAFE